MYGRRVTQSVTNKRLKTLNTLGDIDRGYMR
jgi:hypothetical protein